MDFEELEHLYRKIAESKTYCAHKHSTTEQDVRGVYHFRCPDCGLTGMGNYASAIKLGWLIPHTE